MWHLLMAFIYFLLYYIIMFYVLYYILLYFSIFIDTFIYLFFAILYRKISWCYRQLNTQGVCSIKWAQTSLLHLKVNTSGSVDCQLFLGGGLGSSYKMQLDEYQLLFPVFTRVVSPRRVLHMILFEKKQPTLQTEWATLISEFSVRKLWQKGLPFLVWIPYFSPIGFPTLSLLPFTTHHSYCSQSVHS